MSEIQEMIPVALHDKIVDDLKVQHRYQFDSMKEHYARIFRWLLIVIILLIVIFAVYVFYNAQFETIQIGQEADTAGGTALLNGTGELSYYGQGETNNPIAGQEEQQQEPVENVPDM